MSVGVCSASLRLKAQTAAGEKLYSLNLIHISLLVVSEASL